MRGYSNNERQESGEVKKTKDVTPPFLTRITICRHIVTSESPPQYPDFRQCMSYLKQGNGDDGLLTNSWLANLMTFIYMVQAETRSTESHIGSKSYEIEIIELGRWALVNIEISDRKKCYEPLVLAVCHTARSVSWAHSVSTSA